MKLSQRGEYALRALLVLGMNHGPEVVRIRDIAQQQNIPRRFLEQILNDLKREGYAVSINATWRSPLRQEMLYLYSGLRSWVGLGEATQRQNQNSCHTHVSSDRHPAALAIDIRLSEATSLKEHAAFFHRLGALARHHKLRWGGDWTRRNATWRTFDLGWDPGHVESLRCR